MTLLDNSPRFSLTTPADRPRLLVSVRNESEALAAIEGGVDILDIKEPARGPLGMADHVTIQAILQTTAGRVPVSVAMGELDQAPSPASLPDGVSYYKIGLAGQKGHAWQRRLEHHLSDAANPQSPAIVAVAYWDAFAVDAPSPDAILHWASQQPVAAILIDTADKSRPGLLSDTADAPRLRDFIARAQEARLPVALAGRLQGPTFQAAASLRPAILGVRGAACDDGRREKSVQASHISRLVQLLKQHH
mgnify:CR=1 FL=1